MNNPKLLTRTWADEDRTENNKERIFAYIKMAVFCIFFWLLVIMASCKVAHAENIAGYSADQWANAIRKAEGGNHTKHPYGILSKYKHTSHRKACINTIRHYWRDYSKLPLQTRKSKRFLDYAQERYCPIGANNDPNGLNRNWSKNVSYWLRRA